MLLSVHHVTTYRFAAPMRGVTQSHRMIPAPSASQSVLEWDVRVDGASFGARFTDGAGNIVQTMSLLGPVDSFTVAAAGKVETVDTAGVLRGSREAVPPLAWQRSTRATRPDLALTELAEKVQGPEPASDLDRAHALATIIADAIPYDPGRTHESTTAAEALVEGAGVCQDQAHALIAVALIAGLPARYVTGYLMTGGRTHAEAMAQSGAGQTQRLGDLAQAQIAGQQSQTSDDVPLGEASHAWAEIWTDSLGWVGFDVANRCCPDDRYIRLGCGFDAADAAPIRGVAQGVSEERMEVTVTVEEVAG